MDTGKRAEHLDDSAWAIPEPWNALTREIIASAMEVHTALGPCLLEKLYEEALEHELVARGLKIDRQRTVRLLYKGRLLSPVRLDLVVNDLVIVELKAAERVHDAHLATLNGYLHAADLPLGLVLNFHAPRMKDGLYRRLNRAAIDRRIAAEPSLRTCLDGAHHGCC